MPINVVLSENTSMIGRPLISFTLNSEPDKLSTILNNSPCEPCTVKSGCADPDPNIVTLCVPEPDTRRVDDVTADDTTALPVMLAPPADTVSVFCILAVPFTSNLNPPSTGVDPRNVLPVDGNVFRAFVDPNVISKAANTLPVPAAYMFLGRLDPDRPMSCMLSVAVVKEPAPSMYHLSRLLVLKFILLFEVVLNRKPLAPSNNNEKLDTLPPSANGAICTLLPKAKDAEEATTNTPLLLTVNKFALLLATVNIFPVVFTLAVTEPVAILFRLRPNIPLAGMSNKLAPEPLNDPLNIPVNDPVL